MAFFNSLRELGNTLSLMQSDIQGYLRTIRNRSGIDWSKMRHLNRYIELTGRLRDQEIPHALDQLNVTCTDKNGRALDACLASNIIEVGIDVEFFKHGELSDERFDKVHALGALDGVENRQFVGV